MKTILLIIFTFGVLGTVGLQGIPQTFGLSCSITLFAESYERHDLLLYGKLVEKEILFPFSENQKLTTLTFDTIKVYKGEFSNTFTIKANLFWDDYYREGEEYILFADKDGEKYLRELCVPDYLASPSIIKFLDENTAENLLKSNVTSLYGIPQGTELEDIDIRMNTYSDLNRAEIVNGTRSLDSYVVGAGNYAITWFGALQILIILSVIGIPAYLIYRRKRK